MRSQCFINLKACMYNQSKKCTAEKEDMYYWAQNDQDVFSNSFKPKRLFIQVLIVNQLFQLQVYL